MEALATLYAIGCGFTCAAILILAIAQFLHRLRAPLEAVFPSLRKGPTL